MVDTVTSVPSISELDAAKKRIENLENYVKFINKRVQDELDVNLSRNYTRAETGSLQCDCKNEQGFDICPECWHKHSKGSCNEKAYVTKHACLCDEYKPSENILNPSAFNYNDVYYSGRLNYDERTCEKCQHSKYSHEVYNRETYEEYFECGCPVNLSRDTPDVSNVDTTTVLDNGQIPLQKQRINQDILCETCGHFDEHEVKCKTQVTRSITKNNRVASPCIAPVEKIIKINPLEETNKRIKKPGVFVS